MYAYPNLVLITFAHDPASLLAEITPNSSTLLERKMHVGAKRNGSMFFNEFLA